MKNNVVRNISFKQYQDKYKNHKSHLFSFTKKEVLDFDRQAGTIGENYVLRNRKWALIGDTYYEIPKPIRPMWFKGLSAAGKLGFCTALVGGAAAIGGGGYGIYLLTSKKITEEDGIEVSDDVWNKELGNITSSDSRNFTATYTSRDTKIHYLEDKNREKEIVEYQKLSNEDDEINYKYKSGNTYFKYTQYDQEWKEVTGKKNAGFYFDLSFSDENINLKDYIDHKNDFEFKNKEYVTKAGSTKDPYEFKIKFSKDKKISKLTLKGLGEDIENVYTIHNYGDTSFKFPVEPPEPEPAPEYINYLSFVLDDNGKAIVRLSESATSIPVELNTIPNKVDGKYCGGIVGQEYDVETIGGGAFKEDTTITKVTIPSSIKNIQSYAFQKSAVTSVHFADQSKVWKQTNGETINITEDDDNATYLKNCESSGENNWGFSGIEVNDSADPEYLKYLDFTVQNADVIVSKKALAESFPTELTIPESVDGKYLKLTEGRKYDITVIGTEGFAKDENLTSVIIPNKVKTISDRAFAGCIKLNSITFGSSLFKIGISAFEGCGKIQSTGMSIEIPETVSCISLKAFASANISNATFKSTNNWVNDNKQVEPSAFSDPATCAKNLTAGSFASGLTKDEETLKNAFEKAYVVVQNTFKESKLAYEKDQILINGEVATSISYPVSEDGRKCYVTTSSITSMFLVGTSSTDFIELISKTYESHQNDSYYFIDSNTGDLSFTYVDEKNITQFSIIINKDGYITYLNNFMFTGIAETYSITYKD